MALGTSWLETVKQSLDESGFFELPDFEVGERISTFESRNFPYGTIFALELLVEPVIFDPVGKSDEFSNNFLTVSEDSWYSQRLPRALCSRASTEVYREAWAVLSLLGWRPRNSSSFRSSSMGERIAGRLLDWLAQGCATNFTAAFG